MQGDYVSCHCGGAVTNPRESRSTRDRFTLFIFYHLGDFDMRWRDTRFETPASADSDEHDEVVSVSKSGKIRARDWQYVCEEEDAFWMPMSEIPKPPDRIPDPPEGWKFVVEGDAFDFRCQVWDASINQYRPRNYPRLPLTSGNVYIVPIDPPKPTVPQYRPFANAAEFEPHFGRMIKEKSLDDFRTVVTSFSDKGVWLAGGSIATGYREAFDIYEFANGIPFGVKVEPFEP
jgi:hypothetical protein